MRTARSGTGVASAALVVAVLGCRVAAAEDAPRPSGASPPRPSVLLIVADDMGRELGAYGDAVASTPEIDRLARQGLRFDAAYVAAPTCSPSRAALFTGMYPHANGQWGFPAQTRLKREVATAPRLLKDAGYYTGLLGKLHVEGRRKQFPFDFSRRLLGRNDQSPETMASSVAAFLRRAGKRPFFLAISTRAPHTPYPGEEGEPAWPAPHDPEAVPIPPTSIDLPEYRRSLARMYDAYALADAVVGAALGALEASGRAPETLVILTSDHGPAVPGGKATLYEGGIRVPLVVRWPGVVAPGGATDALVSAVDLLPTLLDAVGLPAPGQVQGRTRLGLLRDPTTAGAAAAFSEQTLLQGGRYYPQRTVRVGRYKYVRNLRPDIEFRNHPMDRWATPLLVRWASDPRARRLLERHVRRPREELYDLTADPAELRDLAGDEEHAAVLGDLRNRLRGWMEATDDPWLALWDWDGKQPDPLQPEAMSDPAFEPSWLDATVEQLLPRSVGTP